MAQHHSMSIHNLHVGGRGMGVILAIGVVFMFAMSVFSIYWFLLGTVVLATILCVFLFRWHGQHKLEFNDLSALEESTDKTREH